jgi:hypothetical protein
MNMIFLRRFWPITPGQEVLLGCISLCKPTGL